MKLKDILVYASIILVVVLIRSFIVTPIKVNGSSMYPTLEHGNLMILKKYEKKEIKRFDIVVIDLGDEKIIKRVIGLPKEDIEYSDNKLYIDGTEIADSYGHGVTSDFIDYCGEDEYFVLGDNREISSDSRLIGCISSDKIMGKTNYIIYPFKKFGNVK